MLDRNIATQYYQRHFDTPQLPSNEEKVDKTEIIKNPIIAEFLGLKNSNFSESDLENAIISHLQDFIMELGRGFAFMGRQQLIRTEANDYYIDLVFYNVVLKCYVLIDLKIGKITHQDVGQMDMYVRMYDELKRTEGDNPTIGIVLCISIEFVGSSENSGSDLGIFCKSPAGHIVSAGKKCGRESRPYGKFQPVLILHVEKFDSMPVVTVTVSAIG